MIAILYDLVREVTNYAYPACLLTILLCMVFLFMREQDAWVRLLDLWHQRKKLILFLFYVAFLLMAAVFGRRTTMPYGSVFKHLVFRIGEVEWNKEIIENTLIFIPMTFLFLNSYIEVPQRPLMNAALLAFGMSLFIELSQLIFWLGEFQFADILYNTIGGLLGFGVWWIYCYVAKASKKKK